MDNRIACESCYQVVSKECEIVNVQRWCSCEEEVDLDCASYGYYEAPRTVYKCQFCLPPRSGYCLVHGMHCLKIVKEKTSTSTSI